MEVQHLKEDLFGVDEWIALARKRVKVPENWIEVEYSKDYDSLYIQFLNSPATHSKDNLTKSVVFDYDENNRLTGIEVINLYSIFV
jgi:uncharacterized protein YuzE